MTRETRTRIDRDYWVGHCEGFQVRSGRRRLGFVQEVLDGGQTLAVRGGFLGRRVVLVPIDRVLAIVPRELRLWIIAPPTARMPRAFTHLLTDDLSPVARIRRRHSERIAA
jgi:hypothetical protein